MQVDKTTVEAGLDCKCGAPALIHCTVYIDLPLEITTKNPCYQARCTKCDRFTGHYDSINVAARHWNDGDIYDDNDKIMFRCDCGRKQSYAPSGSAGGITEQEAEKIGWRRIGHKWTCPFCCGNTGALGKVFGKGEPLED